MSSKKSGCFEPFGCFSVLVVLIGLLVCLWGWQQTNPSNLPHLPLSPTLPALFRHHITAADQQPATDTLSGKPTITAQFIDQVLVFSHSPAAGLGQVLYDDGVQYGIDPVFALAFFMHESQFGTLGVARVTLSLGNLRCLPTYPCDDGYAAFASWSQGFLAWYQLMRTGYLARGLSTLEQIIPVYAPSSDNNNVSAYIAAVKHAVQTWRNGQIPL